LKTASQINGNVQKSLQNKNLQKIISINRLLNTYVKKTATTSKVQTIPPILSLCPNLF